MTNVEKKLCFLIVFITVSVFLFASACTPPEGGEPGDGGQSNHDNDGGDDGGDGGRYDSGGNGEQDGGDNKGDDGGGHYDGPPPTCGEGLQYCDGSCIDTCSCLSHCGGCEIRCFSGQSCVEGNCTGTSALSPEELHEALENKDFLLFNVRVPHVGIIPGTDGSYCNEEPEALAEAIGPDPYERVVLYCRTIPRSLDAVTKLTAMGYKSISYLNGGVEAWVEAGYELE